MSEDRSFYAELKRRKVYQTGVAYVVAALALWGGVEIASQAFDWADRVLQLVIYGTLVGLPIALAAAWIFEVRIEREPLGRSRTVLARALAVGMVGGAFTFGVLGGAFGLSFAGGSRDGDGWANVRSEFQRAGSVFLSGDETQGEQMLCELAARFAGGQPWEWDGSDTDARATVLGVVERIRSSVLAGTPAREAAASAQYLKIVSVGIDSIVSDSVWFSVSGYAASMFHIVGFMQSLEDDSLVGGITLESTETESTSFDTLALPAYRPQPDADGMIEEFGRRVPYDLSVHGSFTQEVEFFFRLQGWAIGSGPDENAVAFGPQEIPAACSATRLLSHLVGWTASGTGTPPVAEPSRAIALTAQSLQRYGLEWDSSVPLPAGFSPLGVPSYWVYSRDPASGFPVYVWLVAEPSGWVSVTTLSRERPTTVAITEALTRDLALGNAASDRVLDLGAPEGYRAVEDPPRVFTRVTDRSQVSVFLRDISEFVDSDLLIFDDASLASVDSDPRCDPCRVTGIASQPWPVSLRRALEDNGLRTERDPVSDLLVVRPIAN